MPGSTLAVLASSSRGTGSTPGHRTKVLHAIQHSQKEIIKNEDASVVMTVGCGGLNCAPLHVHMLKSQSLVPQNLTVFGDRAFKDVVKLKWDFPGGSDSKSICL